MSALGRFAEIPRGLRPSEQGAAAPGLGTTDDPGTPGVSRVKNWWVLRFSPFELPKYTVTDPSPFEPPTSSAHAPTARSDVPSPLKSPAARAWPNCRWILVPQLWGTGMARRLSRFTHPGSRCRWVPRFKPSELSPGVRTRRSDAEHLGQVPGSRVSSWRPARGNGG